MPSARPAGPTSMPAIQRSAPAPQPRSSTLSPGCGAAIEGMPNRRRGLPDAVRQRVEPPRLVAERPRVLLADRPPERVRRLARERRVETLDRVARGRRHARRLRRPRWQQVRCYQLTTAPDTDHAVQRERAASEHREHDKGPVLGHERQQPETTQYPQHGRLNDVARRRRPCDARAEPEPCRFPDVHAVGLADVLRKWNVSSHRVDLGIVPDGISTPFCFTVPMVGTVKAAA